MPPKKKNDDDDDDGKLEMEATVESIPSLLVTKKRLTTARGNWTRAQNQLANLLKEDPSDFRNREIARTRFATIESRFDELQTRFDDAELYAEDGELEVERQETDNLFAEITADYKMWLQRATTSATKTSTSGEAKALGSMIGYHFNARKIVGEKFNGNDIRLYPQFRVSWDLADDHMKNLNYAGAVRLMELKKCLDGPALDIIQQLPLDDGNYDEALALLDEAFKRPIRFAELIVLDLLQAPRMGTDVTSITKGLNVIETAEQALRGLKLSKEQMGMLIFNVICESKLNNNMVREWSKTKEAAKDNDHPCGHTATLDDLKKVIRQQKQYVEDLNNRNSDHKAEDSSKKTESKPKDNKPKPTLMGSFTTQAPSAPTTPQKSTACLLCDKPGHRAADCHKFTKARTPTDRYKVLDTKPNLCRNCLKGLHPTNQCRQPPGCQTCQRKHHALLHINRNTTATSTTDPSPSGVIPRQPQGGPPGLPWPPATSNVASATSGPTDKAPLLQTCKAWALTHNNEKFLATVFLDSGSEITMIRRDLADKMGLDGPPHELHLTGVGGIILPSSMEKKVTFRLQSRAGDYVSPPIQAITKAQLTDTLRAVDIDPKAFPHLKNCVFTEDYPKLPTTVDILIGIADFGNLLTGSVIRGKPDEPVALQTKLGPVLSGSA